MSATGGGRLRGPVRRRGADTFRQRGLPSSTAVHKQGTSLCAASLGGRRAPVCWHGWGADLTPAVRDQEESPAGPLDHLHLGDGATWERGLQTEEVGLWMMLPRGRQAAMGAHTGKMRSGAAGITGVSGLGKTGLQGIPEKWSHLPTETAADTDSPEGGCGCGRRGGGGLGPLENRGAARRERSVHTGVRKPWSLLSRSPKPTKLPSGSLLEMQAPTEDPGQRTGRSSAPRGRPASEYTVHV